jgi:hypothetical protein
MAIPNIVSVSSIYGTTVVSVLTTTLTTTLVTAASNKVHKINLIRCANITDNDATVTFDLEVSGTHKIIANEVTVPANSVVDIVDKNNGFYLQETDLIRGGASSGSAVDCTISYEIMDDA